MEMYLHGGAVATIYHGKCVPLMAQLPARSVNLVCADPPFNTTECEGDDPLDWPAVWAEYRRILAPGGAVVLFGAMPFTADLLASNRPWFNHHLVWDKNKCGSPGLAKIRPMKVHEDILVFAPGAFVYNPQMEEGEPYARRSKKPEGYVGKKNRHGYGLKPRTEFTNEGTRYPKSILRIPRDFSAQQQVNPHQKPVSLMAWILRTYSNPGAVVLDNTMGSGSTGVAALALAAIGEGRNFIGMEKLEEQYLIAGGRLASVPSLGFRA